MKKDILLTNYKVDSHTGCWLWLGAKISSGYGVARYNGANAYTHRVSYETSNGDIPDGLFVLHKCDNPSCMNPEHLFLGTQRENMQDMKEKDRHLYGQRNGNARLTDASAKAIKNMSGTHSSIADKFNVSRRTVGFIKSGATWGHV